MANDENLAVRVPLLEYQMSTVLNDLAVIRANYVTRDYLDEVVARLATKDELHEAIAELNSTISKNHAEVKSTMLTKVEFYEALKNLATKEEIKSLATKEEIKLLATKEEIKLLVTKDEIKPLATKEEIKHLATKEEMQQILQSDRNFFLRMGIGLFFSLGSLQFALFQILLHAK